MIRKLSILTNRLMGALALVSSCTTCCNVSAEEFVRIGYWTSGASLGYGYILEETNFLAKRGVHAKYVHFSDVNAPIRALAAGSIDIAFGAPVAGVFSASAEGVPIRIFAATQPADVQFAVPADSPIKSLDQFKGKKIGMSPVGSSVAAIACAILAGNYGVRAGDFSLVGGSESRLVQFLLQRQVDGAALRSLTIDQLPEEHNVRLLSSFADEWFKLTKSHAVPYMGVGAVASKLVDKNPKTIANVILGLRDTLVWGATHRDEVVSILQRAASLPSNAARVYADHWLATTRVSFDTADVDTLMLQYKIFAESGLIKGAISEDLFDRRAYELANIAD